MQHQPIATTEAYGASYSYCQVLEEGLPIQHQRLPRSWGRVAVLAITVTCIAAGAMLALSGHRLLPGDIGATEALTLVGECTTMLDTAYLYTEPLNDYMDYVATAEDCCQKCHEVQNQACMSWIWVQNLKRCYTMHSLPVQRLAKQGYVSGMVAIHTNEARATTTGSTMLPPVTPPPPPPTTTTTTTTMAVTAASTHTGTAIAPRKLWWWRRCRWAEGQGWGKCVADSNFSAHSIAWRRQADHDKVRSSLTASSFGSMFWVLALLGSGKMLVCQRLRVVSAAAAGSGSGAPGPGGRRWWLRRSAPRRHLPASKGLASGEAPSRK